MGFFGAKNITPGALTHPLCLSRSCMYRCSLNIVKTCASLEAIKGGFYYVKFIICYF